jgi:hypothetical protein
MKKILVEAIEDKMVLAKDVCGPSGNILLSAGTPLSASMGRRLKNWGIHFVHIECDDSPAALLDRPAVSQEDIANALKNKFSNCMGSQIMKKIFACAAQYAMQKGSL